MTKRSAVFLVFLLGAALAAADSVRLRSGRVVSGTILGADEDQIRLRLDNGQTATFSIDDVDSVRFTPPPTPTPAPQAAGGPLTVPSGTPILVRMSETVDSKSNPAGYRFTAVVENNVVVNGRIGAPKGATVHGLLTTSEQARRMHGRSQLKLVLTDVQIAGTAYPVVTGEAQIVSGQAQGEKVARSAARGAALGAIFGAIGGSAGTGAAIGAATLGGIQILAGGDTVNVPAGTLLEFRLQQPAKLPAGR